MGLVLNVKRVPTGSAWTFLTLHLLLPRWLLAMPQEDTPCHRDGEESQIPIDVGAGSATSEFSPPPCCCGGKKQVVNWDPEQCQRLEGDSEFAPGCKNSIDFVLAGNW